MTDYKDLLEHLYDRRSNPPERQYYADLLKEKLAQLPADTTLDTSLDANLVSFARAIGLLLDRFMTPRTLFLEAKVTANTLQKGAVGHMPAIESIVGKSDEFYSRLLAGLPSLLKQIGYNALAYEVGKVAEGVYLPKEDPAVHLFQTFAIKKDFAKQVAGVLEQKIATDAACALGENTTPARFCNAVLQAAYVNAFPHNAQFVAAAKQGTGCEYAIPLPQEFVSAITNVLLVSTEIACPAFALTVAAMIPDVLSQARREQ